MRRRVDLEGRDVVSIKDLTRNEIDYVLKIADLMEPIAKKGSRLLSGKILAGLFWEPSTRTRLSFETAMYKLGGDVIGFASPEISSVRKGENIADSIRVVDSYADVIVLRHPSEGADRMAAEYAKVPVISAGSGSKEHPTQAMLDLYTIKRERGKVDGLNVALLGDLRYGRTVHSLAYALSLYDVSLYLVSPQSLKMRREVLDDTKGRIDVVEVDDVSKVLSKIDILYVTRIQRERFADPYEYEKVKGTYGIGLDTLRGAKKDLIIMHPLPRIDEIASEVDSTPYARYFDQARNGLLVRMALLSLVLGARIPRRS